MLIALTVAITRLLSKVRDPSNINVSPLPEVRVAQVRLNLTNRGTRRNPIRVQDYVAEGSGF